MIFAMMQLLMQFMVLTLLQLFMFGCIAALTLSDNPNFANLYLAIKTYLMSALGSFDLDQYEDYQGFKRWFGLALHVLVLFANMILLINLLIALMSDQYARMSEQRIGLFWSTVIKEMPKYKYD